jgi:dihydrofolate reductase
MAAPRRLRRQGNATTQPEDTLGKLIYATNTSLDGFTEDVTGSFDWTIADEELHVFYTDMMRAVSVQLMGRRMYETMAVWETDPAFAEESPILADFAAAWQDTDKVVYSTTLADPLTRRTRIVRAFDVDEARAIKDASSGDLSVSGPELTGHALRAGLVDEVRLVLAPVTVGAGKPAFPTDLRVDLELVDERRFSSGAVHVAYRVI